MTLAGVLGFSTRRGATGSLGQGGAGVGEAAAADLASVLVESPGACFAGNRVLAPELRDTRERESLLGRFGARRGHVSSIPRGGDNYVRPA